MSDKGTSRLIALATQAATIASKVADSRGSGAASSSELRIASPIGGPKSRERLCADCAPLVASHQVSRQSQLRNVHAVDNRGKLGCDQLTANGRKSLK
jgi:hypothetical protein